MTKLEVYLKEVEERLKNKERQPAFQHQGMTFYEKPYTEEKMRTDLKVLLKMVKILEHQLKYFRENEDSVIFCNGKPMMLKEFMESELESLIPKESGE